MSTDLTASPEELVELDNLHEAATPGPWRWWTSCSWRRLSSDARGRDQHGRPLDRDGGVICPTVNRHDGHPDLIVSEKDMALIVAIRNALPRLISTIRAQEAEIGRLLAANQKDAESIAGWRASYETAVENQDAAIRERDEARRQVEAMREALEAARAELEAYEHAATGEAYNSPSLNAALASASSSGEASDAG